MKWHYLRILVCPCAAGAILLSGCASDERVQAYHEPLTSVGARFGALPVAVQNAIRAESGTAEIRDIDKELRSIGTVYKITYVTEELYPPLFIASDGSVINPDMSVAVGAAHDETTVQKGGAAGGLHFNDLPAAVAETVEATAPRSDVQAIDKGIWGSRIVYIISFHDETRHPRLYVESDGTVLRDVHR
jgi:hypothetical protein